MKKRFLKTFLIAAVSLLFLPAAEIKANTIPEGNPDVGIEAEPAAVSGYADEEEEESQPALPKPLLETAEEGTADEETEDAGPGDEHIHTAKWVIQIPPTCTEEGTMNLFCEDCGTVLNSKQIPLLEHEWKLDPESVIEPTCEEPGRAHYICVNDPEHTEDRELPAAHDYEEEWTTDLEPTCTEPGSKSHHCTVCDKKSDITEIEPLGHSKAAEWKMGEDNHWRECERCGVHLDEAEHSESDWILDVKPDYGIPGIKHTQCPICETIIRVEDIPELIKPGIVEKDVEKTDDTAPDISFNNSLEDLKEKLLSEDDLNRIENGESVKIYLEATNLDSEVAEEAKAQIAEVATEAEEIRCMDISLYKKVGDDSPESLHNPPVSISVTVSVPKDMRKEGRNYRMYRIHDGEVEYVQGVYFPAAYEFGFFTDKFSVYALTYDREERAEKPNIKPENPATSTTSPISQTAPETSGKTFPPELGGCLFFGALMLMLMAHRRV